MSGTAIAVPGEDIDTDRIIPARFLKCVSFEALGDQVFADDRLELSGEHPFDQARYQGASILVVNGNFAAVPAVSMHLMLMRWGIRAVVGVSFAEIFYGNCLALGIPCATAAPDQIKAIQAQVDREPGRSWRLDLAGLQLTSAESSWPVSIDAGPLDMLRSGRWDATSQLLDHGPEVAALMQTLPYINQFAAN